MSYKIPIFLSYPKPYNSKQEELISNVCDYLDSRGFIGRTLGVTDYDMDEPLTAIRRLMLECNGIMTIALRRSIIKQGEGKPLSDIGEANYLINNQWITSPYCQIEPAMAFQIGLPILIFREKGVIPEGILEKGVAGTYLPEVDLDKPLANYMQSQEWLQLMGKWEGHIRTVVKNKGLPPRLY